MELGLQGRAALVTGGDSGIGWETAKVLLAEGATMVLSDRDADEPEKAADLLAPVRVTRAVLPACIAAGGDGSTASRRRSCARR
ncbi:hypothetical protein Aab01nite_81370 [Paractinoplanes abujensis]|uniref:SDR family NAD(P)-dependent oxidoreductase n=1 Tax=Paractinoplanes abujensis TaxID=882441 RepID=UPI0019441EFB|nr:SDR family NAD(P)-dependent oxidoreductase [Actinoplanes abujensis]GID24547.1 hypothetical protein Aab01nite_81370 [Actinoplanes abujensis]